MASTTSPSCTSPSLHPPSASNKRPASMSVVTPNFIFCPIKHISRPSSSYAELESPPSSPLQKSTFSTNSDSHDRKQPQQQQQQQQQPCRHGRRRLNESRPIQIPMDPCHASSTSRFCSGSSARRSPFAVPILSMEKKNMYLNTPSTDGGPAVARPLSPPKRISSLSFRQQSSHSLSSISIHPSGRCSSPINMKLDGSEKFEDVPIDSHPLTPTPTTTTTTNTATALITPQNLDSSIEGMDIDTKHDGHSPSTSSAQIPGAIRHTNLIQAPRKIPSITINSNYSNVDLTNGVRNQSSASNIASSPHCTSFEPSAPHHPTTTTTTTTTNNGQEQDPSVPKRRKTLLKSMSSSMRVVKKRAADMLFGSARNKRNKMSKTLLPDHDEVDEGLLVTKTKDLLDEDEDYDMSTLSLSSTVAPSAFGLLGSTTSLSRVNPSSSPMDVEVISLASCLSESSRHIAPPLTAVVAADLLKMSSWLASSDGPSLFTRSAEDLTRLPTSSFYDFSGCDPSIIDNGHQTLAVETEAGPQHWHCLRRRSHSVSAACMAIPQESPDASSISFARHLHLHYDLEDIDINDESVKQSHGELQRNTFSRFGGLGYRKWILSKNNLPSFMTKHCRKSGKKGQKGMATYDVNRFALGCVGGNLPDPLRDRDVCELMELIDIDSPVYTVTRKTNKTNMITREHSTNIPSSPYSSSSSSHTFSPSSLSPTCATPFQHAIERRKKAQQYQHQYKQERDEQQQSALTSKAFRRAYLTPDALSAPPTAITCQLSPSPSIVLSSAQSRQQVFVPNP